MHATTGDFLAAGDMMDVRCLNPECRRTVWIGGQMLLKRFPQSVPIAEAERRMRCKCGHRGAEITIGGPKKRDGDRISFGLDGSGF